MRAHGAEQGRLEPSAILVAAFEIKIGRPGITRLVVNKSQIARARFQPHVEDVSFLLEPRSRAMRTLGAGGKNRVRFGCKPGVRTCAFEKLDDFLIHRVIVQRLAAAFTKEHRDGHAPHALPRDAPIRPGRDHVRHPLFAPPRIPFDLCDCIQRARPQLLAVHADKPLLCCAENNRVVTSPAMRIAVVQLGLFNQCSVLLQQLDDNRIRLPNCLRDQRIGKRAAGAFGLEHSPARVYRAVHGKPITLPDDEVLLPMSRCRVDRSSSLL